MHCYYINLDSATDRRQTLEQNLLQAAPHWSIHRITAIDAKQTELFPQFNSSNNPPTTGNYLSHLKALEASLEIEEPVLIMEDDTHLGQTSATIIENFVAKLPPDSWDLIYTSITFLNINHSINAFTTLLQIKNKGELQFIDSKTIDYACATTYLVNTNSKTKLIELLKATPKNCGYDFRLREIFLQNKLKGLITLPFVTSVSEHSANSQANGTNKEHGRNTDLVLNAFRKLLFIECAPEEIQADLTQTDSYFYNAELRLFGTIIGKLMHPNFTGK